MSAAASLRQYLAMDLATARVIDMDGRLHVGLTPISRACVSPYYGAEIPEWETLGLNPRKLYKMFRDPGELARAASSFNRLPILVGHAAVSADDPRPEIVAGATGSDAIFANPFLMNSIVVWTSEAIRGIQNETAKDISSAYRYRADMRPGIFKGERFDGTMRDIVGSHVALVKEGRVPGALVLDGRRGRYLK